MKRHWWPVVALLLLTSCTEVKSFGAYWDKGFVDPAVGGRWRKIADPGYDLSSTPGVDTLLFVLNGSSYSLQVINPIDAASPADQVVSQREENEKRYAARTLTIGHHKFLIVRLPPGRQQQDGIIERYEIKGGILHQYNLTAVAVAAWLQAKHPTARNITATTGQGGTVVIDTFDDEVFQLLSEIADDPKYWDPIGRHRKVSG